MLSCAVYAFARMFPLRYVCVAVFIVVHHRAYVAYCLSASAIRGSPWTALFPAYIQTLSCPLWPTKALCTGVPQSVPVPHTRGLHRPAHLHPWRSGDSFNSELRHSCATWFTARVASHCRTGPRTAVSCPTCVSALTCCLPAVSQVVRGAMESVSRFGATAWGLMDDVADVLRAALEPHVPSEWITTQTTLGVLLGVISLAIFAAGYAQQLRSAQKEESEEKVRGPFHLGFSVPDAGCAACSPTRCTCTFSRASHTPLASPPFVLSWNPSCGPPTSRTSFGRASTWDPMVRGAARHHHTGNSQRGVLY